MGHHLSLDNNGVIITRFGSYIIDVPHHSRDCFVLDGALETVERFNGKDRTFANMNKKDRWMGPRSIWSPNSN